MCLEYIDQKLTEEYKNTEEPIVAWKLIRPNNRSLYKSHNWVPGLNISSRKTTSTHKYEMNKPICKGFHCFIKEPLECHMCLHGELLCVDRYTYICTNPTPKNKLIKVLIDPKDVVAVGNGTLNTVDIIATKATWVED